MKNNTKVLLAIVLNALLSQSLYAAESLSPGFEQKKLGQDRYRLNTYGVINEPYSEIKQRWHGHAVKLCGSTEYQSTVTEAEKQKYFWQLSGCTQYPVKKLVRTISGQINCSTR